MYIDTNLEFSDAQAITATAISEDVYDTLSIAAGAGSTGISGNGSGNILTDLGQATDLYLVVIANTAAAGGDSAKTLTITLESDSTANLATSATVHFSTGAILGSAITAGARLATVKLPHGQYERYLGLRFTVSAGFTAFNVDAFLTTDGSGVYRPYATNFVVV
jgi:hypothetical protein